MNIEICPLCGCEMTEWHNDIWECEECEQMIDVDVYSEEEEDESK